MKKMANLQFSCAWNFINDITFIVFTFMDVESSMYPFRWYCHVNCMLVVDDRAKQPVHSFLGG